MGGVSQAMYKRGSSTRSFTSRRRSAVIGGVVPCTGGISGPRFRLPKYFSTNFIVWALSISPTIARLALLGE